MSDSEAIAARLRSLPKVDVLLADPTIAALPRAVAVGAIRAVLDRLRALIRDGSLDHVPPVPPLVLAQARVLVDGKLQPVINATGVVVHTNLGRAPWAPQALDAVARVAGGYCDLELDLASGTRGGRLRGPNELLAFLTGCEAALVVNNNAAAVLLALTALARGKEVICSRGELVEIGGSFRVPDVIASGGARLVEVGTTNRTRASDYAAAIGPDTALLLKVHPSNFRIVGFTEEPDRADLVALGRARGVVVVEDLGSGCLARASDAVDEPTVREVLATGVDLVMFSADKLLGGPQAGVIAGRRDLVEVLRKHPMYRALRVDKVILAALEATLVLHAAGAPTPVDAMIRATSESLVPRAAALVAALRASGVVGLVVPSDGAVGGGAVPGRGLPGLAVRVVVPKPDRVEQALRVGRPAVLARVADGALLFDVRTVPDVSISALAGAITRAITAP
jgi:L-seryl-tRNA(Ser) seleniumtransferase